MVISHHIKKIGRGARGARPLTRDQAADLFGQQTPFDEAARIVASARLKPTGMRKNTWWSDSHPKRY